MSEQQTKSPIELVTELLGTMAARAVEAERQRDKAKKNADEWYGYYQNKDAELKEVEAKLGAEIAEHQNTRQTLREALDTISKMKGEQDNG